MVTGIIYALKSLGWGAMDPERWISPEADIYELVPEAEGEVADTEPIMREINRSAKSVLWKEASKFHNGKGLEAGADTSQLKRHIFGLEKHGLTAWAGAIRRAATAGSWTRCRLADSGAQVESRLCQRCPCRA